MEHREHAAHSGDSSDRPTHARMNVWMDVLFDIFIHVYTHTRRFSAENQMGGTHLTRAFQSRATSQSRVQFMAALHLTVSSHA